MSPIRHHAIQVPATSANLGPGYDALGAALTLHLRARSRDRLGADRVTTDGEGAGEVPTGDDNLLWRSLVRFCERFDAPVPDVALHVVNDVPLERGLGSSSAAIVAGLGLGRALTGTRVSDLELVRLATEVEGHPDNVAPAVLGGFVAGAVGDDGELVVRRVNPHTRLRPLAFVPEHRQSTEAARGIVPESLSRADVVRQAARSAHVVGGLTGVWPADAAATTDVLHEPSRLAVMTGSGDLVAALRERGLQVWLSGAGPTVAASVAADDAAALAAAREIAAAHDVRLLELGWDLRGVVACPDDGCALAGGSDCVQCPRQGV